MDKLILIFFHKKLILKLIFFFIPIYGLLVSSSKENKIDIVEISISFGKTIDINSKILFSLDSSRRLKLNDVLKKDTALRFEHIPSKGLNLGYTRKAAWLRVSLRSQQTRVMYLSLTPPHTDLLDFYVEAPASIKSDPRYIHYALGDHRPVPPGQSAALTHTVPITLPAQQVVTVYIRAASVGSSLNISARLIPEARQPVVFRTELLISAMWLGCMSALVIMQLAFLCLTKQRSYAYLALSTLGVILVYSGLLGISRLFLFSSGGIANDRFLAISVWYGLLVNPFAAGAILDLRNRSPLIHRFFQFASGVGLAGMIFAALGKHVEFAPYGSPVILILAALAMYQSIRDARSAGLASYLRCAAFVVLWIGITATIAQRDGWLNIPDWLAHAYPIASTLQMLLLTCAVAVQLKLAERLNKDMRERMIVQAQEAEQRATDLVEVRTRELANAKRAAEDALRAEFRSKEYQVRAMEVISHQYRTPLSVVRSNLDSMALSLPPNDQRVVRAKKGISRLVETMEIAVARSRMEGPAYQPDFALITLREAMTGIVARLRDIFPDANLDYKPEPGLDDVLLEIDLDMFNIAIINIVENAVKYSRGVTRDPLVITESRNGDKIEIAIADRGIGIPPDQLSTIMAASVRGANAQHLEGSGMGLSLVNRIAGILGGAVSVSSVLGEGTTICFSLPLGPLIGRAG